ncbi:MAG: chemotaxis protein CheW [Campylobacterales bacterium]|nr:chemotaxis protein CheW [Campylobacterales bacterium]
MCIDMLLFSVSDNNYALPVTKIVRVLWALEITPVPKSPKILYGVFDLHGKMLPVISLRELLSLPKKEIALEDSFIILTLHSHQIALLVDHTVGVFALDEEDSSEAEELFKELSTTHIVRYEERLTPVLDIDALLDSELIKRVADVDD